MPHFNRKTWKTPDTYDTNYAEPIGRGVYLLCRRILYWNYKSGGTRYKILYVGMSNNLADRLGPTHEVLRELRELFDDVVIYFRNYESNLREIEREFINRFNPPYNIIGKRRGL